MKDVQKVARSGSQNVDPRRHAVFTNPWSYNPLLGHNNGIGKEGIIFKSGMVEMAK